MRWRVTQRTGGLRPHNLTAGAGEVSFRARPTRVLSFDPEPCFVRLAGVKPRAATAEGGLGLTLASRLQAQLGDRMLGHLLPAHPL